MNNLLAIFGMGIAMTIAGEGVPNRPTKPLRDGRADYRDLRKDYDKLGPEQRGTPDGRRLRERLSKATEKLIKAEVRPGTPRTVVVDVLGAPWGEFGDEALYPGDKKGFFHQVTIVDGKVTRVIHGFIHDIEGGR